jgi:integrase
LHDFRHTFAVRALEACPTDPASIDRHVLALSTYLGHGTIGSTFWYLHTTPSMLRDVADSCEAQFLGGVR